MNERENLEHGRGPDQQSLARPAFGVLGTLKVTIITGANRLERTVTI